MVGSSTSTTCQKGPDLRRDYDGFHVIQWPHLSSCQKGPDLRRDYDCLFHGGIMPPVFLGQKGPDLRRDYDPGDRSRDGGYPWSQKGPDLRRDYDSETSASSPGISLVSEGT